MTLDELLAVGLAQSAAGDVVDLGSFAQYVVEDDDEDNEPMFKVTTETGRQYLISGGFWMRLAKPGDYQSGWVKTWRLMHGTHFSHPWDAPEGTWSYGFPVVGQHMHVGGKDEWYTSTLVVKIEEVD